MSEVDTEQQGAEVSIDKLFGNAVKMNQVKKDAEALLDQPGTYVPTDGMQVSPKIDDDGRVTLVVAGKGTRKDGVTTFLRVYLSPIQRFKEDGKTPDYKYGKWIETIKAFVQTFGTEPATEQHVVEFLQKYPVAYTVKRIGHGLDADTMVTRISATAQ